MAYQRIIFDSDDPASTWRFQAGETKVTLAFANGEAVAVDRQKRTIFRSADPFAALAWMEAFDRTSFPEARWLGFIGYEFARHVERLPESTRDDLGLPLFQFSLCTPETQDTFRLKRSRPLGQTTFRERSALREQYEAAVVRAIDYIAAGDVFQVNLSHRLTFKTLEGLGIWGRFKPSRYAAYLADLDKTIISNSPELFFRIEPRTDGSRRIINRPIKGTRPRQAGMAAELLASEKDKAELAMIVDLQRNDLGRVCEIGSVVVSDARSIEAHAGVYHTVATVEGTLRREAGFADVIRALFPCGSITGCPKIRAMQIIDELEPVARGPYCGAIGYLAADGSVEFNVAIRTMVVKDGFAHVHVGGGIVADSTPRGEYDETIVKAQAMLAALNVDEQTLRKIAGGE